MIRAHSTLPTTRTITTKLLLGPLSIARGQNSDKLINFSMNLREFESMNARKYDILPYKTIKGHKGHTRPKKIVKGYAMSNEATHGHDREN